LGVAVLARKRIQNQAALGIENHQRLDRQCAAADVFEDGQPLLAGGETVSVEDENRVVNQ
jgi:hypothetical protein